MRKGSAVLENRTDAQNLCRLGNKCLVFGESLFAPIISEHYRTFWDTVVICLLTGLVVVTSVMANGNIEALNDGGKLTHAAFGQIPVFGTIVLTFGLFTFAFSTILGWSYYGEKGAEYLFGPKSNIPYRVIYVVFTFLGTVLTIGIVWELADALNALMTIPNIIAILLLSPEIAKMTKYYVYENRIDEVDSTPIPLRKDI